MWANRVITTIVVIIHIPLTIITLFTTFISGLVAAIPLVNLVYILALSLVWQFFMWPLIAGAWTWSRLPAWLSWPVAVICVPLALVGDVFLKLTGALSADPEDRIGHFAKQSMCQRWPYVFAHADDGRTLVAVIQDEYGYSFWRAVIEFNDLLTRRQLGVA